MKKIGHLYVGLFMFGPTYTNSQELYKNDLQWKIPGGNYIDPTSFFSLHSFMGEIIYKIKWVRNIESLLSNFFYNLGNSKIFNTSSIGSEILTSLSVCENIKLSENFYNYSDYIILIEFENELNNNPDIIIATDNFKI
ncbi:MAG: hypothetical protein COB15_16720 [Flavobacteriales bacterium]|nr:MAG: hypothetical protein COB15_16720 [Flavobacteriales bacterium]